MRKLQGREMDRVKKELDEAIAADTHERDSTNCPIMGMHTWNDIKEGCPDCPECGLPMHTFFLDYDFWWCEYCYIVQVKEGRKSLDFEGKFLQ